MFVCSVLVTSSSLSAHTRNNVCIHSVYRQSVQNTLYHMYRGGYIHRRVVYINHT